MPRTSLFLCLAFLVVSGTFPDFVSPSVLPEVAEPKTVRDVEPYTVKVVMTFVFDLEKECPKTREFKEFFERLKAFAKYVCPISQAIRRRGSRAYEADMRAKAGSLFQAISSFAARKSESREVMILKQEQREAMNIVGSIQSISSKFRNRRNHYRSDDSMELTAEQKQAIKERIIRWQQVITRVVKTMVESSRRSSSQIQTRESSSQSSSANVNGGSGVSMNRGSNGDSGKAQTTVTPRGSRDDDKAKGMKKNSKNAAHSAKNASIEDKGSNANSPKDDNGGEPEKGNSSGIRGGSQVSAKGSTTVDNTKGGNKDYTVKNSSAEIQGGVQESSSKTKNATDSASTSNEVMGFIIKLEKKCPETEEFKSFFEKLKAYMRYACPVSSTVGKKTPRSYISEMMSIASKLSDAMALVQSRTSKSRETKNTMENYQREMMKTLNQLQDVTSKVVKENQSKQDGSVTVTQTQKKVIKETITRWEQVTTQFVETAVESETQSSARTESSTWRDSTENRKTKSMEETKGEASIAH
ncbi:PREDICTED: uncharacterized protein LOC104823934 [Tarenaya hassleriana]|uniref:uncharacterized protein LOC104823934 n=1 Tax=Tarenaya hassleriana TaxID=28532 RepID=UPI00053C2709|nr:PREDICTED: uncharacterized protein LOC104823934 [Tarenaya hassleriana]